MSNKKSIFIIDEKPVESIAKDIVTFGLTALLVFLNHKYLDASSIVDLFAILVVVAGMFAMNKKKGAIRMSEKEAIEYFVKKQQEENEREKNN